MKRPAKHLLFSLVPALGLALVLPRLSSSALAPVSARKASKVETITILQTADMHGQLLPHQEMFIEHGKFVFKQRGGLANVQTIFKRAKAENPGGTVIVDGGDLIQGSAVAALS